jgi:hypothetical protein
VLNIQSQEEVVLKIREEQMQVLMENAKNSFIKDMVLHLQNNFARELAGHDVTANEVEGLVRSGIDQARDYGIEARSDVQSYLEFMALLGPSFDKDDDRPWIGKALEDPALNGHEKIQAISGEIPYE